MTLDIATRRKWLDDGIALARMIDDQIASGKYTQAEVANYLGISESHISQILNPCHQATFSILHLIALLHLLDGETILRRLCALIGKFPVDLPNAKPNGGRFCKEVGELQIAWDAATKDGKCSLRDAENIHRECVDILAVVEAFIAEKSEQQ